MSLACAKQYTMTVNAPFFCVNYYWRFAETGNAVRRDSISVVPWNAFPNTTSVAGRFGNAVHFNTGPLEGGLSGPSLGGLQYPAGSKGASFWFWIRLAAAAGGIAAYLQNWVSWSDSVNPQNGTLLVTWNQFTKGLTVEHTYDPTGFTPTSVVCTAPGGFNPNIGDWHFIGVAFDAANHQLHLNVDGLNVQSVADGHAMAPMDGGSLNFYNNSAGADAFAYDMEGYGLSLQSSIPASVFSSLYNGGAGVDYPANLAIIPVCNPAVLRYWTMAEVGMVNHLDQIAGDILLPFSNHLDFDSVAGLYNNALHVDYLNPVGASGNTGLLSSLSPNQNTWPLTNGHDLGLSVVAWVFLNSVTAKYTFLDLTVGDGLSHLFDLEVGLGTNSFFFYLDAVGTANNVAITTPGLGAWTFIHLFFDKTTGQAGYSFNNGVENTFGVGLVCGSVSKYRLSIQTSFSLPTVPTDALWDEVLLNFNGKLSPAQLAYLYNGGAGRTWPIVLP